MIYIIFVVRIFICVYVKYASIFIYYYIYIYNALHCTLDSEKVEIFNLPSNLLHMLFSFFTLTASNWLQFNLLNIPFSGRANEISYSWKCTASSNVGIYKKTEEESWRCEDSSFEERRDLGLKILNLNYVYIFGKIMLVKKNLYLKFLRYFFFIYIILYKIKLTLFVFFNFRPQPIAWLKLAYFLQK